MKDKTTANQRYCRNCHFPLPATAVYCPQCSQKYTTGKVTVYQLFTELINNLFNLDSKLFKTLGDLFLPAKLTTEYFNGRHKRYAHPLRVFLVSTLIFVTALSLNLNSGSLNEALPNTDQFLAQKEWVSQIDSIIPQLKTELNNPQAIQALDSAYTRLYPNIENENFNFSTVRISALLSRDTIEEIKLHLEDTKLSHEELEEKFELDHFLDKLLVFQMAKFFRDGDVSGFVRYLIGNIIWILFLVIPFIALLF